MTGSLSGSTAFANHGASVSEEARHAGAAPHVLPDFNLLGFNNRWTDLQAAVGSVQLTKLDRFIASDSIGGVLRSGTGRHPVARHAAVPKEGAHAWQAFVVYVDPRTAPRSRNDIMERLHEMGIATRPGTHAVHMLGHYRDRFGFAAGDYPGARDCDANTMAIRCTTE